MENIRVIKKPIFFLMMIKTHYLGMLEQVAGSDCKILINGEGIEVEIKNGEEGEEIMKNIEEVIEGIEFYQIILFKLSYKHLYKESGRVLKGKNRSI
jgi:hypothetical protein